MTDKHQETYDNIRTLSVLSEDDLLVVCKVLCIGLHAILDRLSSEGFDTFSRICNCDPILNCTDFLRELETKGAVEAVAVLYKLLRADLERYKKTGDL